METELRLEPTLRSQVTILRYLLNHGVDFGAFILSSDHRCLVFIAAAVCRHNRYFLLDIFMVRSPRIVRECVCT